MKYYGVVLPGSCFFKTSFSWKCTGGWESRQAQTRERCTSRPTPISGAIINSSKVTSPSSTSYSSTSRQETVAAQDMLLRFAQWQGRAPESLAADTTYGNGEFLQWLADRSITPYMRTRDSIHRKNSPFYAPERFTYRPESNSYRCPAGQQLNYGGPE